MNLFSSSQAYAACFLIALGNVVAAASLESPAGIDRFKQPSSSIREFSSLLEAGKFKSLYKGLQKYALTFKDTTLDNVHAELTDKIWRCYLMASLPVFSWKTYQSTEPEVYIDETDDLSQKFEICLLIGKYIRLVSGSVYLKEAEKKQIITRLLLPYDVHMLKQLKNAHEHNPFRVIEHTEMNEEARQKDIVPITSNEQVEDLMKRINEIADGESFINTRNHVAADKVKLLEEELMDVLVSVFPGNYSKIVAFILEAGYAKDDIPGLIDRTVGRSKKTDFLYKGKHRKEYDRLLKKKKAH